MMTTESTSYAIAPQAYYRSMLAQGKFVLQRCVKTQRAFFYPRVLSPYAGGEALEWFEASGEGVVYSSTVIRRKADKGGDYNVALIDLTEGARLMSRVDGVAPSDVKIGMRVKAEIQRQENGEMLLVFRVL